MTLTAWTGGVQDQARVEERHDVLVYTSAHLITPVAIAGPGLVRLTAATGARDTDFTASSSTSSPTATALTSPRDHPLPLP